MYCEDPAPIFLRLAVPHSCRALPQISVNSFDSHRFVCLRLHLLRFDIHLRNAPEGKYTNRYALGAALGKRADNHGDDATQKRTASGSRPYITKARSPDVARVEITCGRRNGGCGAGWRENRSRLVGATTWRWERERYDGARPAFWWRRSWQRWQWPPQD